MGVFVLPSSARYILPRGSLVTAAFKSKVFEDPKVHGFMSMLALQHIQTPSKQGLTLGRTRRMGAAEFAHISRDMSSNPWIPRESLSPRRQTI